MNRKTHSYKSQKGFTLIESLLTLFILSIGLLGIAGMQIRGLESGGMAMQQMAAVMKTQEMMERMRAAVVSYGSGNLDVQTLNAISLYSTGTASNTSCLNGTICNAQQMVLFDLYQWEKDMENLLPGSASPSITVVGRTVTIAIELQAKDSDDFAAVNGGKYTYTVSTQL